VAARLLQVVGFAYRGCSFTAATRVQIPGTPNQRLRGDVYSLFNKRIESRGCRSLEIECQSVENCCIRGVVARFQGCTSLKSAGCYRFPAQRRFRAVTRLSTDDQLTLGLTGVTEQLIQNQLFDRRFLRELGLACGSPELDQVGQPSVLKATSAFSIVLLTKIRHE
jgi:hypothetical protein